MKKYIVVADFPDDSRKTIQVTSAYLPNIIAAICRPVAAVVGVYDNSLALVYSDNKTFFAKKADSELEYRQIDWLELPISKADLIHRVGGTTLCGK